MTNRDQLAWALSYRGYTDGKIADIISDYLMGITDEDDCSIAVILGDEKKLLTEWLGKESNGCLTCNTCKWFELLPNFDIPDTGGCHLYEHITNDVMAFSKKRPACAHYQKGEYNSL